MPPDRLEPSPLYEAVFEARFVTSVEPEIVVGRLSDIPEWHQGKLSRLPAQELPPSLRRGDPNLALQPLLQIELPQGHLIKIGELSLAVHALQSYRGWPDFVPQIKTALLALEGKLGQVTIQRLGLRYINAFSGIHGVRNQFDLNISFAVAGSQMAEPCMLTYSLPGQEDMVGRVAIVAPPFVAFVIENMTAMVDVDVNTPPMFTKVLELAWATDWVERAHSKVKDEFFRLFSPEMISLMVPSQ